MKATGIVRRLDDLGRLVIPKEIRRIYKLKEGDSIEFFVNDNSEIILKKFSILNEDESVILNMCSCLGESTNNLAIFITEDNLLGHEFLKYKDLTNEFLNRVKIYRSEKYENINISKEALSYKEVYVSPVIMESQFVGAFILLSNTEINDVAITLTNSFAQLLTILSQQ